MTLQESIQLCTTSFKLTKAEALIFVNQQHSDQPADVRAAAIDAAYPDAVVPASPIEPAVQAAPRAAVKAPVNTPTVSTTVWTFKDIALPMIARGVPVTPLHDSSNKEKGKAPRLDKWQNTASTDPNQIALWDRQFPNANCGSVAQAKIGGYWMLEIDAAEVWDRIERETGKKIPLTFSVRSGSQGRGHFYFKQTPESIQMENIAQTFVQHGDWSARCDREQCVSPGSVHPKTGRRYEVLHDVEIIEAPAWLVSWCISQKVEAKTTSADTPNDLPIVEGGRNTWLASMLGKARQTLQMDQEMLENYALDLNGKRCSPPLSEEEALTVARSIGNYAIKDTSVLVGGKLAGTNPIGGQSVQLPVVQAAPFEVPPESVLIYPKFPSWVMQGTSIYEGFCKPSCDQNSRYPEYMFLPAVTLLLNYIAVNVRIEFEDLIPNIFMISIGKRGETIKSSCANDACEYFRTMDFADHASSSVQAAGSKTYIFTVGSSEGLGVEMQRTNCKHVILFYDEFSKLVDKSGIQSSSLAGDLLTLYESDKFANGIKTGKSGFAIPPKTYAVGLIACTTTEDFPQQWGKLANGKRGLDDRFFFLLQPEVLDELTPPIHVECHEGAQKTKLLIEKAIQQKLYKIQSPGREVLAREIKRLGNRTCIRAEKFALYFAVDLGLDEIDLDCLERGLALAKYEQDVKRYLLAGETESKLAGWQNKLRRILQHEKTWSLRLNGRGGLKQRMESDRLSTIEWRACYNGLLDAGFIEQIGQGKDVVVRLIIPLQDPTEG